MKKDWKEYSDLELVMASLVGNLQAFDELTLRYCSTMQGIASRIVGAEAARDVVQESLLLAFKALPQLEEPERFDSWIYSITRHRAFRYLKTENRFQQRSDLDQVILKHSRAIVSQPDQILADQEKGEEMREAIKRLPEEYQVVIRLYYWEEASQQEIASFLEVPLTTVKWRLHKAKQLLKNEVKKNLEEVNYVNTTGIPTTGKARKRS